MQEAKAVSSPVVSRIVDSGREIHAHIVAGRKPSMELVIDRYLPEKLKHPEKLLP